MTSLSPYPIRVAECAAIPKLSPAAHAISPETVISSFQLIFRAKQEKCSSAAAREAKRKYYLALEQEAFADILDEDEVYRSFGIAVPLEGESSPLRSPCAAPSSDSHIPLLYHEKEEHTPPQHEEEEKERESSVFHKEAPSESSLRESKIVSPNTAPDENRSKKSIPFGSHVALFPEASQRSSGRSSLPLPPPRYSVDAENANGGTSKLSVIARRKENSGEFMTNVSTARSVVLDVAGSPKVSLEVKSVEKRVLEHSRESTLEGRHSSRISIAFASLTSNPSDVQKGKVGEGILDTERSAAPPDLLIEMKSSTDPSLAGSPTKLKDEVEDSSGSCPPLTGAVLRPLEGELCSSSPSTSPTSMREAIYSTPVKSLKLIYPLTLDISPAIEESLQHMEDEVFPGAHKIMRDIIYDAYGLIPSVDYRMTSGDFFDSVTVVGLTANTLHNDCDGYSYKTDMRYPSSLKDSNLMKVDLWRNDGLLQYIDTWWNFQTSKDSQNKGRKKEPRLSLSTGFQMSRSTYPKLLQHLNTAGGGNHGNFSTRRESIISFSFDWINLVDCCLILVNGLGNAFRMMHEKKEKSSSRLPTKVPPITEDHIRLWALQYIRFGLHRLLTDQMATHTMIFRSVFSLLCSVPAQRLPYSVFTSIFLSKIVGRLSLASIEQRTNMDYRCSCIKKRGVPYLPFALFLREICAKEITLSQIRRGRSVSPSSAVSVSLLKVWDAIEVIMQPSTAARLFHGMEKTQLKFPVYFVRRGLEALAGLRSSWQALHKCIVTEPRRGPKFKESDKTPEELIKDVVHLSSVATATHVATKCLLILVLFVNWMDADCRGKDDGDVDVRSWTQRVFAEANAYYRVSQKMSTDDEQKSVCADVAALFYAFFDTSSSFSQVVKYLEKKDMIDVEVISILRQQVNDALVVQAAESGSEPTSPVIHSPTASSSTNGNLVGDDENFNDRPNGSLLLDGLIEYLKSSVGTIFFSYDAYMDGVVTYFSSEHVNTSNALCLNANSYKAKLRDAKNPFKEMEAVAFCIKTFNSIVEKSMGYLQAFWGATRWLRLEIDLCIGKDMSSSLVGAAKIPTSFQQCALLLGDCIIAGWPHHRKQQIPFQRIPQKEVTKRKNSFSLRPSSSSLKRRSSGNTSLLRMKMNVLPKRKNSNDQGLVGKEKVEQPFSLDDTLAYSCISERSADDMFGDLVLANDSESSF